MPSTERTLVLVKPDGVQRQLVGRILARYEERGLKVVGLKLVRVDARPRRGPLRGPPGEALLRRPGRVHHVGASRRRRARGPNAIAVVRAINGATRPHEAAPGTIRGDFALETAQNIVHASDGPEAADDRARALVPARASSTTTTATSTAGCSRRPTRTARAGSRYWVGIGWNDGPLGSSTGGSVSIGNDVPDVAPGSGTNDSVGPSRPGCRAFAASGPSRPPADTVRASSAVEARDRDR